MKSSFVQCSLNPLLDNVAYINFAIKLLINVSSSWQLGLGVDCDQHSPRKVQGPVDLPPTSF